MRVYISLIYSQPLVVSSVGRTLHILRPRDIHCLIYYTNKVNTSQILSDYNQTYLWNSPIWNFLTRVTVRSPDLQTRICVASVVAVSAVVLGRDGRLDAAFARCRSDGSADR